MNPKKQNSETKTSAPVSVRATANVEPQRTPEHMEAWASMTTGIEDYARWQQEFADRTGAGDPPFRRGRIWT